MKVLSLMNGKEFILDEDAAKRIEASLMGPGTVMKLPTGELVNKSSFSSLTNPETVATWWGYTLDKSGRSFMRDGERCYLEPHNIAQIEYKLHPKYGLGDVTVANKELPPGNEEYGLSKLIP